MAKRTAIVIGAGIVGLATARALAIRGFQVKVFERNEQATGASIRNFGMIWPIGQPDGVLYERAMLSRRIWKEICAEAGIWHEEIGSMHVAHCKDEMDVLRELAEMYRHRDYHLLGKEAVVNKSPCVVKNELFGGLYSPHEMIVDPRVAIKSIPVWLHEKYGVEFLFGKTVTDIAYPSLYTGAEEWSADEIYVCSGADFETLYPQLYADIPITKCKLQMMRMRRQPGSRRIGPALCGSLSLIHYQGFKVAPSLLQLLSRYKAEYPEYLKYGIHVMVAQNEPGELTIGDSHEYGLTPGPFDQHSINDLILSYLAKFAHFEDERIIESWHGVYAKMTNGQTHFIAEPEAEVMVINGLGGAGMTLSFGLCEEIVGQRMLLKENNIG